MQGTSATTKAIIFAVGSFWSNKKFLLSWHSMIPDPSTVGRKIPGGRGLGCIITLYVGEGFPCCLPFPKCTTICTSLGEGAEARKPHLPMPLPAPIKILIAHSSFWKKDNSAKVTSIRQTDSYQTLTIRLLGTCGFPVINHRCCKCLPCCLVWQFICRLSKQSSCFVCDWQEACHAGMGEGTNLYFF